MPFFTERFDRWRERTAWIPAWLDDKPWKSWFITHTGLTLLVGALVAIAWSFFLSIFTGHLSWSWTMFALGTRGMILQYAWREVYNARENARLGKKVDYLDHFMDVFVPLVISELINQNIQ